MGQRCAMQHRLQHWRALNGPDKEVFFPQDHRPGEQGALDFTCCNELGVTLGGQAPFSSLSKWSFASRSRFCVFARTASVWIDFG